MDHPIHPRHRVFNYEKDTRDTRDHKLFFSAVSTPSAVDLRAKCPPVIDQGALGSCTACAVSVCHRFQDLPFNPSVLFIYYNSRALQGTVQSDSGSSVRNAIKMDVQYGSCSTTLWPYVISKYTSKPPKSCYTEGLLHQVNSYASINRTANAMEGALASGFPVAFGFLVYDSFVSNAVANTGIVPMPNTGTEQLLGGHAMMIVGYNRSKQQFIVQNSWGTGWGDNGYCYMPYSYILSAKLSFDFWVIYNVEKLPKTAKLIIPRII